MELSRLLKFYEKKIGQEISSDDHFLLKYKSSKKNSVFKKEDFEALKKDLQEAAKLDFVENDIGPSELLHLYNQKVDKKHKEYSLDNLFYKLIEEIEESEQAEQPSKPTIIEQLLENEKILDDINDEKLKKYTKHEKYSNIVTTKDLNRINTLDEKALKHFDNLLSSLPEDIVEDSFTELTQLAEFITDENFDFAKEIIQNGLPVDSTTKIFSNKNFNKETATLLDKTLNLILDNNENEEEQKPYILTYKSSVIEELFSKPEITENFKTFLNKFEKDLNSDTISEILDICSNKNFEKAMELLELRSIKTTDSMRIEEVVLLEGENYDTAKELFANKEYDKLSIQPLLKLEPEKREKIKDFVNQISEDDYFWKLEDICQLNNSEIEQLKEIYNTQFNGDFIDAKTATQLAKEPKEILEKIKNYKNTDLELPNEILLFMLTANDTKLENFIKAHKDYIYEVNTNKKTLDILKSSDNDEEISNKEVIRYSKHTKSFEPVNTQLETHSSTKVLTNTQEGRVQNIEYERIPSGFGDRKSIIKKQEIKTFDNNNNLSKTELYEVSPTTGLPNIKEIDYEGNEKNLQQTTIDKHGNLKLTKNFTSPNGTKTEYQLIEDEVGNRRSIHKITDKYGNILLDKTSSLKIISKNKYLSTENGKSFEIEYIDDEIIITNPQNKKTKTISLKKLLQEEDKERVLKLLKTMSAEQLLIMNIGEINSIKIFSTDYPDGNNTNNGSWNIQTKSIEVGDSTYYKNSREYLQRGRHVLLHEYGHFIDELTKDFYSEAINQNEDLKNIFRKEYTEFMKTATIEEEKFIEYFAGTNKFGQLEDGGSERCAEANLIANGTSDPYFAMRGYYLERYFPESVAANINEIEKIEQLALEKSGLL